MILWIYKDTRFYIERKKLSLLVLFLIVFPFLLFAQEHKADNEQEKTFRLMFYNVENYFDSFDDTLTKHEGKKIQETQSHHDHSTNGFVTGHQYFTSVIVSGNNVMPLFPKLYSKNTDSKIEMASNLINFVIERMKIHNVIMDSWYSDKKIIKKCITKGLRVICGIKANRKISLERGKSK